MEAANFAVVNDGGVADLYHKIDQIYDAIRNKK